MTVFLISGKARAGKDTTANIMKDNLAKSGSKVLIVHYADLLKFICKNYFGWNGKKDESGRELLQYVGTDVIRKEEPDMWVGFVAKMLKYFGKNWDYVIIPDCRFENEISVMEDNGFDVVHIRVCRDVCEFTSGLSSKQKKHASETALDNVVPDECINNNGTLCDLNDVVKDIIHRYA